MSVWQRMRRLPAALAATVAPIPGETMAGFGSVGNVDMLFVTDDAQCFWEADRCGPILSRNR